MLKLPSLSSKLYASVFLIFFCILLFFPFPIIAESLNFNYTSGPISYTVSGSHYNFISNFLHDSSSFYEYDKILNHKLGTSGSVLYIPQQYFGQEIKPSSFKLSDSSTAQKIIIRDDGEGNLLDQTGKIIGNIIYNQGLIIFTGENGVGGTTTFNSPNWESTVTIYETQYKCTIRSNELNYSLNPSLLTTYGSGSIIGSGSAVYKDFVTGSDFSPFVTTVGLYNDENELVATAKLSKPLLKSFAREATIRVKLDY